VLAPTFVNTEMSAHMLADESFYNALVSRIPLGAHCRAGGRDARGAVLRLTGLGLHHRSDALRGLRNHGYAVIGGKVRSQPNGIGRRRFLGALAVAWQISGQPKRRLRIGHTGITWGFQPNMQSERADPWLTRGDA
jgi:hypothetical protein